MSPRCPLLRAALRAPVFLLAAPLSLLACGVAGGGAAPLRVERRDLVVQVPLTGELEAVESADLGPPPINGVWEFTIASLVADGTEVAAGAPVLGFDVSLLEQQLQTAIAERDAAAGNLTKREADLRAEQEQETLALAEAESRLRLGALKAGVDAEVLARKELDLARIDRDLAEAEVRYRRESAASLARRAESELAWLRAEVDRTADQVAELEAKIAAMTVRAPRGGRVVYKTDWQGQKKKVGDRVWRLDVVMQIPNLRSLRARGEVDEAQSGRVAPGQRVELRLDAHPDLVYTGRIAAVDRAVRPRSSRDARSVVSALIALDRTDEERMRPGMRLQGSVEIDRREGVVAAPLLALGFDEAGAFVRRRGAGGVKVRPTLGARDATWVEVLEGLEPGDRLEPPGEGDAV